MNFHSLQPKHLVRASMALGAGVLSLLTGCIPLTRSTPSHLVRVNSTASEPVRKGAPFFVVPVRGMVDDSTLLYTEVSRLIKGALLAKGLPEAPRIEQAAVVVEIEYGMAPPRAQERISSDPTQPQPVGLSRAGDEDGSLLRNTGRGPLDKHLVLTAREANAAGDTPTRTLWRVEISAVDLSNDLRKYLPLLAAAGFDQMGQDSGGSLLVRVNENDKTAGLLKQANQER